MKNFVILVDWISPNAQIAVRFEAIENQEGFYNVYIAGKLQGTWHRDFCGIRLAEELVTNM